MMSRRDFLAATAAASACGFLRCGRAAAAETAGARRFHLCLDPNVILSDPEWLDIVARAGVSDIWLAAFFYGHWFARPELVREASLRVEAAGLRWHVINVPLGHPGDSLGDSTGETPLTPPGRWQMAVRPDGSRYSGTSLHPPATEENVEALRALAALNPDSIFLDDDFRLATGPGVIGGCFCEWHRERFLTQHGYAAERWEELLTDVRERRLSPILRAWVDFTCDELTASFRAQQAAIPGAALGNMIMYLGAEKAGIRLSDYADVPFRVGELMFNDASFDPVKGKTDELFSALFHRRYAKPDLAFSESTAFPADQLSAANMAAKLVVSTISDVRNTMYMSGVTPFPKTHWDVLAPAMQKQARHHETLKGHRPQGPFKHYWGEGSRYVGDDQPFSLFLATGIPFEVTDSVSEEGWTFLADADAQNLAGSSGAAAKRRLVCRPGAEGASGDLRAVDETLDALWPLKHQVIEAGLDVPYVVEDLPVVCAWYPSAKSVLLWNLTGEGVSLRLQWDGKTVPIEVDALDTALISA